MYRIIGADGREYGPVTLEQLRRWIVEGRANAQTVIRLDGGTDWKPLGDWPEFAAWATLPAPIAPVNSAVVRKTNGFATASLVCGILSVLCCCGFPIGVLGIIFALVATSKIKDRPDLYQGRNLAIIGLILSLISLVLSVLMFIGQMADSSFHFNWD